jgi:hypothetical protein
VILGASPTRARTRRSTPTIASISASALRSISCYRARSAGGTPSATPRRRAIGWSNAASRIPASA